MDSSLLSMQVGPLNNLFVTHVLCNISLRVGGSTVGVVLMRHTQFMYSPRAFIN